MNIMRSRDHHAHTASETATSLNGLCSSSYRWLYYRISFATLLTIQASPCFPIPIPSVFISPLSFSHTLERKYMFLICNGILAFLAKTSSVSSSSELGGTSSINSIPKKHSFTDHKGGVVRLSDDTPIAVAQEEEPEYDVEGHQREEEQNYYESLSRIQVEEQEEERESEVSVIVEDDDDDEESEQGESDCRVRQEEGTGGAANEEVVSTEELNRKFEEFIRKMKEEIS